MTGNAIIKNSSVSIGYMGILGWGSAYFYGWGTSDYYEFPWWFVAVNHDDIARSLFYAFTIFLIFLVAWGTGFFLFLGMKRNTHIFELSFGRLYFSVFILFTPVLIELSVIRQEFWTHLFILLVILSLTLSVGVFICKRIFKDTINNLNAFIKRNLTMQISLKPHLTDLRETLQPGTCERDSLINNIGKIITAGLNVSPAI